MTHQQILLKAPLWNSDLSINREVMGTTEPVNTKNSIENELFIGQDGGRNRFIYVERSCTNPTTEIDMKRVNIRPRTIYILLDY